MNLVTYFQAPRRGSLPKVLFAILLVSAFMLWQPAISAYAATITVTTFADEFGANPAACSLREAIEAANTNAPFGGCPGDAAGTDIINLPAGVYTLTLVGGGNGGGDLDITSSVILNGAGANTTIIQQTVADRVVEITAGPTTLNDVTITGGTTAGGGTTGGGINIIGAGTNVTINRSRITGNTATDGNGGGIRNRGVLTVNSSTIDNNTATEVGGSGNGIGGGINNTGTLTINTSTISGNRSAQGGGGIINLAGGVTTITSATITQNVSDFDSNGTGDGGGGLYIIGGTTITITNTIIAANIDNNLGELDCAGGGTLVSGGFNLVGQDPLRCDAGAAGNWSVNQGQVSDIVGVLPTLGALALNAPGTTPTHALQAGSRGIDEGGSCGATDQRGVARPQDGDGNSTPICDIGAYEREAPPDLAATKANNVGGTTLVGVPWTWTITVTNTGASGAVFLNGQTIFLDSLPNINATYGAVTIANVVNVTNSANIACSIDGTFNLICTASGADVTLGATTGSFDIVFNVTPTAAGTFDNPRAGGTCLADPNQLILEPNETNNNCADTVIAVAPNSLVATAACNGNNLDVNIASGDGPFNINGGGPGLPQLGVGLGVTSLAGPGTWVGVTVNETGGDQETLILGSFTCPTAGPGGTGIGQTSTTSVVRVSDPAISKRGDPLAAVVGEHVTWTVELSNPGSTPTGNLVFMRDPIPDMFDILSATTTRGHVAIVGQEVRVEIGVLQPGEQVTITIETVANDRALPGEVCNTASADWNATWTAHACVKLYPQQLPPTGGRPGWTWHVESLWWAIGGAALILSVTGWFVLRRQIASP